MCALALLFKFLRYFSKFSRPVVVVPLRVVVVLRVAAVVGAVVVVVEWRNFNGKCRQSGRSRNV